MLGGGQQSVLPLRLHALTHDRAAVVVSHHLGQQAVAQPQGQITEAGEIAQLHEFSKDHRSGHDDLRPARPDPRQGQRCARLRRLNSFIHFTTAAWGTVCGLPSL